MKNMTKCRKDMLSDAHAIY